MRSLCDSLALYRKEHMRKRPRSLSQGSCEWEWVPGRQQVTLKANKRRPNNFSLVDVRGGQSPGRIFKTLLPASLIIKISRGLIDVDVAYRYFGLLALIHATYCDEVGHGEERNFEQRMVIALREQLVADGVPESEVFGWLKFKKLNAHFLMRTDFALDDLSLHWSSLITSFGETVCLDEKMRKFLGSSPYKRFCPNKPEPRGHWTSQLCTWLDGVHTPFCFGMYPVLSNADLRESVPVETIWDWAIKLTNRPARPMIVADSYYSTKNVLEKLECEGVPFLVAGATNRFEELAQRASSVVHEQGESSVLRKEGSDVLLVHHWDVRTNIGRKFVFTNNFSITDSAKPSAGQHLVYRAYSLSFDACDYFNRKLFKFKYPFRRRGWEKNFDSLFVSTLLINSWVLWQYSNPSHRGTIKLREFCHELGLDLIKDPNPLVARQY